MAGSSLARRAAGSSGGGDLWRAGAKVTPAAGSARGADSYNLYCTSTGAQRGGSMAPQALPPKHAALTISILLLGAPLVGSHLQSPGYPSINNCRLDEGKWHASVLSPGVLPFPTCASSNCSLIASSTSCPTLYHLLTFCVSALCVVADRHVARCWGVATASPGRYGWQSKASWCAGISS